MTNEELAFNSYDMMRSYNNGCEQMKEHIITIIESRLSEIIGDAQPKPALRAELEELIKRIKEAKK